VKGQALTGEMAKSLGLSAPEGVIAADVWPDSPAARAGIGRGDVIVSVNGHAVNDPSALNYSIATLPPGATAALMVRKAGGAPRTVEARLETPPDTPAKDQRTLAGRNPLNGATVINLSPAAATDLGLDPFSGAGVVVTGVAGGYAASFLQPGDFIRQINGQNITSVGQLATLLAAPADAWAIVVQRGSQVFTVQVRA
jgi:S1-C subfamily serine protease